jgi:sulfur relay (sulfurtransferase) DsrC/TusE family protein
MTYSDKFLMQGLSKYYNKIIIILKDFFKDFFKNISLKVVIKVVKKTSKCGSCYHVCTCEHNVDLSTRGVEHV